MEERKWKEIEASLMSSIPNAGNREAAAVRAVGGDSVFDDSFARERVSSIARRIRAGQLSRRALQLESGPVCLWEFLVAGSEQGIEAGQVGLRLITKGDRQTTVSKEWSVGASNIADGRCGRLGDCWFLSAVAVLTEVSRISEVIITPEYNEEGIYTVRFCIQGEWVPVVIDDWIPCESPGKPAFATSRKKNELLVSILEKAYAKLHGSYEALEGVLVQDALVDVTGGAGEEIDMRSTEAQIDLASGRLWSQVLRFNQEGFLLGAGSASVAVVQCNFRRSSWVFWKQPLYVLNIVLNIGVRLRTSDPPIPQWAGAVEALGVREVDGYKLVQIRNPWQMRLSGMVLDLINRLNGQTMKHKLQHVPQAKDGIFWMSWPDFQIHFRSIYVCRVYPPDMRYSVHGQWRGCSAGGCQDYDTWHQNPQFCLKARGPDASLPIHVFITLTQVLLSPSIVVYSPRVLPVYVYDAHTDCGKNVSGAFLLLYGVALAIEGWGVVASLKIYPPFAGAAVSAITLVVAFGFAVSRPCLTLETRNALSGTYSAPQREAAAVAAAVRAVGGDSVFDDSFARERVSSIARRIRAGQLSRRALQQGIEAGQVGLRLITKGDRQTTVSKEWSVGASNIADGRWHIVTLPVDADLGEVSWDLDGNFDGYQTGLPLHNGSCVWEQGTEGRLGDCWFLSAVAVLTEVSRISEVIITPEYNEEGIYTVRFCIQGEWVPVIIDDWIPCESPGKPAFATSRKKNELWVSILEKAYAKLHGSYEALEGGLVQDAVDVTGGAGEEIDMRSTEAQIDLASGRLWSQVLRFNQEGFLLGAGSASGSDVHISLNGIVQGHAFSILQVREVDGYKLVQIRNPWANEVEWNGP
ncbi:unnamed protein product [Cuscuta campestris]|uniref:Calpain catalytic domain-containing protein n=1 Tax=Cuscuta campestris TaxID=132261 RepID=A0A484KPM8_9ASTE|nr:unnamed protein product [Cuscuta campestris]